VRAPYCLCELFLFGALFALVTAKIELRIVLAIVKLSILVVIIVGRKYIDLEHRLRIRSGFRMLEPAFADGNEIGSGETLRVGGFRLCDQFVNYSSLGKILFRSRK
jgi:hypothetical protein